MSVSYSEKIVQARLMTDALRKNLEEVTKIDEDFVSELERHKDAAEVLNTQQEKLKADLKAKTQQLEAEIEQLTERYNTAKKRVKIDIPQAQWKEYGIADTK